MERQDLKEYLGMVKDMEAECYFLESLRQKLSGDLASIRDPQPKVMIPPVKPTQPVKPKMPVKPESPKENKGYVKVFFVGIIGGVLIPIALSMFFPLMYAMFFIPLGWILDFLTMGVRDPGKSMTSDNIADFIYFVKYWFNIALKYGVVPGAIIGGCIAIPQLWKDSAADDVANHQYLKDLDEYECKCNEISNTYNRQMQKFQADMAAYQDAEKQYHFSVKQDNERIQTETANNEKKRSFLKKELSDLEERENEAQRRLRGLYSGDIIFPKYQNLIAVCAIHEYICAGRCSTLGEAYNILEMEKRLDYMIAQRDCSFSYTVAQLNELRAKQYELFTVLQSNERRLDSIERSNHEILQELIERNRNNVQSDELSSYYEELERKERDYQNRKDRFR